MKKEIDYIVGVKKTEFEIKPTLKKTLIILIVFDIVSLIYITISILTHFFVMKLDYINVVYSYIPVFLALTIVVLNYRWRLVLDNKTIYIYKLFKHYQLKLKNVIYIGKKEYVRMHCRERYICILYLDKKNIKKIQLEYKRTGRIHIQHIDENDINELVNNFIRNNEIEKFNENEYTKIRTDDEEKIFERDLDEIILKK